MLPSGVLWPKKPKYTGQLGKVASNLELGLVDGIAPAALINQAGVVYTPKLVLKIQLNPISKGAFEESAFSENAFLIGYELFTPKVALVVKPTFINNGSQIFSPAVSTPVLQVRPPIVSQTAVIYSPKVTQSVKPNFINQTGVTFSPKVTQTIKANFINNGNSVYSPKLVLIVKPTLISQTGTTFTPKVV